MKMYKLILFFIAILFIVGCSANSEGDTASTVEAYINALADQKKKEVINLSCKSWEEQAGLEVDALLSVGSAATDLNCEETGNDGAFTLVKCQGSLDLTYNEEIRSIDLNRRTYYLQKEDGQWRICSYK